MVGMLRGVGAQLLALPPSVSPDPVEFGLGLRAHLGQFGFLLCLGIPRTRHPVLHRVRRG